VESCKSSADLPKDSSFKHGMEVIFDRFINKNDPADAAPEWFVQFVVECMASRLAGSAWVETTEKKPWQEPANTRAYAKRSAQLERQLGKRLEEERLGYFVTDNFLMLCALGASEDVADKFEDVLKASMSKNVAIQQQQWGSFALALLRRHQPARFAEQLRQEAEKLRQELDAPQKKDEGAGIIDKIVKMLRD
jgi:hypothetical protein